MYTVLPESYFYENANTTPTSSSSKSSKAKTKEEKEAEKQRKEDLKKREEQLKKDEEEAALREREQAVKDRLENPSSSASKTATKEDKKYTENPNQEYKLTNPNQELGDILNTVYGAGGAVADGYNRPAYTDVINPQIYGVNDLANVLGVNFTYDRNEIEKIYQDATQAALKAELNSDAERKYYSNLAAAQNTAMDTIRQQYGSAVAAGANKGMQAANMLSAILGTTQTANEEATQLAADRQQLVNKYAQQMRQDSVDALNYSNDIANTIGSLSHQLYNDMIQQKTAELAYNQGINTDYAGYMASKYTADSNLKGQLAGVGAGVYNNNQSAIAALQAAIETGRAQENSTKITKS